MKTGIETTIIKIDKPINGYSEIHRCLHYVDGNVKRVVIAFSEEELILANNAPDILYLLEGKQQKEFWIKSDQHPTVYGKYLVHRKDGKIHLETWNGSQWAYNDNVITHWAKLEGPKVEKESIQTRKQGYYRCKKGNEWIIAEWITSSWWITGHETPFIDSFFDKIDEQKIETTPVEQFAGHGRGNIRAVTKSSNNY